MPAHTGSIYKLPAYTVEHKKDGWYYAPSVRLAAGDAMRGPYSTIAEVSTVIARQLKREIEISAANVVET